MNSILFKKLRECVKQNSVSQLENVKKKSLKKWLPIAPEELQLFLDDLHQQRFMEYKFNCTCSGCGEPITIYENEYTPQKIIDCRSCGMEWLMETLIDKGEVLYVLNKQEILSYSESVKQSNSSLLEGFKSVGQGKVIEMKGKPTVREKKERMKIFIGSSKEQIPQMRNIAVQLEQLKHEVVRWNKPGLFTVGEYTFESLVEISKQVDGAVFIWGEDDDIWYRGEFTSQPRDNVFLEYGLFAGQLGKEKVIIAKSGNPKISSDLQGITFLSLEEGESTIQLMLEGWIAKISR